MPISQEVAEVQAQELEHVIESVLEQAKNTINDKDLATKGDVRESELRLLKEIEGVRKEIAQASNKTILLLGTFGVFFLGVLAKGFHWF